MLNIVLALLLLSIVSMSASFKAPGSSSIPRNRQKPIEIEHNTKFIKHHDQTLHATTVAAAEGSTEGGAIFARALGYVMGTGAMLLYTPMIFDLLKARSSNGYSAQTWFFNLLGLTACIAYPFRRGFPISTYIENVALTTQAFVILTLVCFYRGLVKELFGAIAAYTGLAYLMFLLPIPKGATGAIQILSTVFCNYALLPQIIMNFQLKQAKWSAFTALLSAGGNFIRIFTTMQLTKDKLILGGHVLGLVTNSFLLLQIYFYRK
jgi:mannose-P-dolichol utilization defect protein 1